MQDEACSIKAFGCPGQTAVFSVSIVSDHEIPQLAVLLGDFTNGEACIVSAESSQVYFVKVWELSGSGLERGEAVSRAELLLKDDREPLSEGYMENPSRALGCENPAWLYQAPDLRLEGPARTSLLESEAKQVLIRCKIPKDVLAGVYSGRIYLEAGAQELAGLPLELEVLPFELRNSDKDLMIWYRGSLDPAQSQFYLAPELYRLQLAEIRERGFTSISICERETAFAQQAVKIAEELGFDQLIVFMNVPENSESLRFQKLKPVYYLSDELDLHKLRTDSSREAYLNEHRAHGAYCDILGWASLASIKNSEAFGLITDKKQGYIPDLLSLDLAGNRSYFAENNPNTNCKTYYHWYCHLEKANLNRVLSGLYLWKSGADGIAPYCFQHPPVFPFSPYDDFQAWEPDCKQALLRHKLTTYPARRGTVSTLQWEGLCDGLLDLRYLATLEAAIETALESECSARRALALEAAQRRDAFLNRIVIEEIDLESGGLDLPYREIKPVEYQAFRYQIAMDIVRLISPEY